MFSWRCFPFVDSTPRAYRLKASNAAPLISTSAGTIPELVAGCEKPNPIKDTHIIYSKHNLAPYRALIRWYSLKAALGEVYAGTTAIPDPVNNYDTGSALFARSLVRIAQVQGQAVAEQIVPGPELVRTLMPSLLLFHKTWSETRDWHGWHAFRHAQGDYFAYLIEAASAHGPSAIEAIDEFFDSHLDAPDVKNYWPPSTRRRIAMDLFRR